MKLQISDFFTLDVADYIGEKASEKDTELFLQKYSVYKGELNIPGIEEPFHIDDAFLDKIASTFLFAALEAGKIYKRIAELKGNEDFIAEVSMDEVDDPQTPAEPVLILLFRHSHRSPHQSSGRQN